MIRRIKLKALALGILAGLGVSFALSIILAIALRSEMAGTPSPGAALASSTSMLVGSLASSLFASFLAGLVGARAAPKAPVLNAFAVGALIVVLSVFLLAPTGASEYPLTYNAFAIGLAIPLALLGGKLAARRAVTR